MTSSWGSVDANGPLAFQRWPGAQGLSIVCVHGLGATSAQWVPVAEQLRTWGTVVAVDLPGFGESPLSGRAGLKRLARAVGAVVDDQGAQDPVVLCGSSVGAAIAVRVAAERPERVRALVLGSGYLPPYFGGWRAPAVLGGLVASQVGNLGQGTVRALLASALGPEPSEQANPTSALPAGTAPSRADHRWSTVRALASLALLSALFPLARAVYDRPRCPVLVLHGKEDPYVPVAWAHHAARRYGYDLRVLPAVAHVVELGNPEWWLEDVGGWLVAQGLLDSARVRPPGEAAVRPPEDR